MIKPNEIRIGNYVTYYANETPFKIKTIVSENDDWSGGGFVECSNNHRIGLGGLKPIPLTEQWLLDFGFHKNSNSELSLDVISFLNLKCYLNLSESFGDISHELEHIKSVHQLQNLYFALTGKELTINAEV